MSTNKQKNTIIILASHNKGKVLELKEPFLALGYDLKSLDFLDEEIEEIEETGLTFEENALLKARYVADKTGYIAIADDSGLEIEALDNAPSIYSARYANRRQDLILLEENANVSKDHLNILQVLKDMRGKSSRNARFTCCLALAFANSEKHLLAFGHWEGQITEEMQGENGFGYDPIFFDPLLNKTSAQLTKNEKMAVSHRAKAIENLVKQMKDKIV